MKKVLIIAITAVALVLCLIAARWADSKNRVTSPSTAPDASSSQPASSTASGDIENGLGWG